MAIEVGTAYISILPETSKIAPGIKKALGDFDKQTTKPSEKTGKVFGEGLVGGIGKVMKGGALAIGGVAAAGIGTALFKGMGRLKSIDEAKAKLAGLGHSTKTVDTIMNNALTSVKGTAYGLGDAAGAAAGAVASGVKPGKDLERTLTLMGDAATIAGVGFNEMGPIFNKVAAGGKVTGEVMNQLGDRGVPILQLLGDQMGTTATETRKMVSEGKVDFDTFRDAIEAGMGGAAQESGKTFSGAMANTQAALGRLGAAFLGPVFAKIPDLLDGLIAKFDEMGPTMERVGEIVGSVFEIAIDLIGDVVGVIADVVGWFIRWQDVILPVAAAFGVLATAIGVAVAIQKIQAAGGFIKWMMTVTKLTKVQTAVQKVWNIVTSANPIMLIVVALIALAAGLVVAYKKSETFRKIVQKAFDIIKGAAKAVADFFTKTIPGAFQKVLDAAKSVWGWIKSNWPLLLSVLLGPFGVLLTVVIKNWGKIRDFIVKAWGVIRDVFVAVRDWVVGKLVAGFKTAVDYIKRYIKAWWTVIRFAWEKVIRPVFRAVRDILVKTVVGAFRTASRFIGRSIDGWKRIIKFAWTRVIQPVLRALRDFLIDRVLGAFRTAKDGITRAWNSVRDAIRSVWNNGIKPVFDKLRSFVRDTIPGAFRSAKEAIGRIWGQVQDLAAKPVRFIIKWVYNAGIREMFNKIPGVPDLPYVKLPFAKGGVLPGYSPGRDIHTFYSPTGGILRLSGGEAIMRPEWTRAVGGAAGVRRMNDAARRGRAFARGGTWQPVYGRGNQHTSGYSWATWAGDYPVPMGTAVKAWKAGVIAAVKYLTTSYGIHIRMNHDDGTSSLYAHLSRVIAQVGQRVAGGQTIGLSGSTGNSTGPHLHFETMGGPYTGGAGSGGGGSWFGSRWVSAIKSIPGKAKTMWGYLTQLPSKFGEWGDLLMGGVKNAVWKGAKFVDDKIPNRFLPPNPVQSVLRALTKGKDVLGMFANINSSPPPGMPPPGGPTPKGSNAALVRRAMTDMGWGGQWAALSRLVNKESRFDNTAQNPASSAFGMFQFLDGTWGTVGATKTSDPWLQAQAGMRYIKKNYGDPNGAWRFWQRYGWYDRGGILPAGGVAMNASKKPEAVFNQRQFRQMMTSAVASGGGGGGVYALTITNWQDGTGYIEALADDRIDAADTLTLESIRASGW